MKIRMKRIMGFFLALVMVMGSLPLNPIVSYANDDIKIDAHNFPDANFRKYVSDRSIDGNGNGYLTKDELDKVKKISIIKKSISSLKGIEYFKNLKELYCYENKLESLDVSKNTKLTTLDCSYNKLTSLDVGKNINLNILLCYENKLESLDVSKNTKLETLNCKKNPLVSIKLVRKGDTTSSTYRVGLFLTPVEYTVKVEKGSKKIPFNKLPQGFDKNRIQSDVQREEDGFTWDGLTNPIKFKYQLCENPNEAANPGIAIARAEITVTEVEFNPEHVEKMEVTEQPKKLTYTEGEKLDLTGLVVKLTDNQGLTKEVKFKDFNENKISAKPANGNELQLANSENPVTLTRGNLQGKTANLTVNKAYTITYTDGVKGEEIFKNQVTSGILSGSKTPKFTGTPSRAGYEFTGWNPTVADKVTADATYVAQWKRIQRTVTFKDGDKTHAKVKVETGKAINTDALTNESMPKDPTKDGYTFKEWNTKENGKGETFTGESVVNGDMTVYAIYTKDSALTPTPTPTPTPAPTPTPKPQPKTPDPKPQPKPQPETKPGTPDPKPQPKSHPETSAPASIPPTPELKLKPETPAPKPKPKLKSETLASKPQAEAAASKPQPEKQRIDMTPKTGESASYAGLLAALGFSIAGLAILCKKNMMKENK